MIKFQIIPENIFPACSVIRVDGTLLEPPNILATTLGIQTVILEMRDPILTRASLETKAPTQNL